MDHRTFTVELMKLRLLGPSKILGESLVTCSCAYVFL